MTVGFTEASYPEGLRRSTVAKLGLPSKPQLATAAGGFLLREGDRELKE